MDRLNQAVTPGRLEAVNNQQRELFNTRNIVKRFWSKDLSLWPTRDSQLPLIQSNLAWVDLPDVLEPLLAEMSQAGSECIREGLVDWVFLALGSSSLAARALLPLVEVPPPGRFTLLDSNHPSSIQHLASRIDLMKSGFILANKVGDRLEDHALFLYFQHLLKSASVPEVSRHFVSVTERNSFLAGISQGYMFRASFLDPLHLLSSYCSLIHFGALLISLSQIEAPSAVSSVRSIRELCKSNSQSNPALQLAIFLSSAAVSSCRYLFFLSTPSLSAYSNRLGHLIGGSLAKEGAGLIPVCGDVPRTTDNIEGQAAFVFLKLAGENDPELTAKLEGFRASGVPCVLIEVTLAADLLPETFKWEIAVALACASLGFNPFDWPDIRQPRKTAMDLLENLSSSPHALDRSPRLQESGIQLFAEGRTRSEISNLSLSESLRSFLRLHEQNGFIVLYAFLERTPEVELYLRGFRETLTRRLGVPVVLQFGPRCSDQYPYLCRSGLPPALYIVITTDYPIDIPIPGAGYTFSQLHLSLVLGEFESMVQTDRPVIRLNLQKKVGETMASLGHLLTNALPRTP